MNQPHGVARNSSGFVLVSALLVVGLMMLVLYAVTTQTSEPAVTGPTVESLNP